MNRKKITALFSLGAMLAGILLPLNLAKVYAADCSNPATACITCPDGTRVPKVGSLPQSELCTDHSSSVPSAGSISKKIKCTNGDVVTISRPADGSWTSDIYTNACAAHGGYTQANDTIDCTKGGCIENDIQLIVNVLSIGVGIVVTAMIIIGGIQYMTSRDNAQATQAAKTKILNAVIAMVAFMFVYVFLQWIIPGGIF